LLLAEWLTLRARLGDWVNVLREGLLLPAVIVPLGATALSGVASSLAPRAGGSLPGMLLLGALIGSLQLFWLFPRFARVARAEAPGDPQRARTYGALWVAANVVAFLILAGLGGAIARAAGWTLAGAAINGLLRGALYGLLTGLPLAWLLGALPPGEGARVRAVTPWRGER
jgi:hypothetical protein